MTFALIVLIVLCASSAALYCQSDVRRLSPESDDTASTTRALGCVEARPVPDLRHGAGTGKVLFASTGLNRTEQQERQGRALEVSTGISTGEASSGTVASASAPAFSSSVPAASGGDDVVGGALLRTPPTTTKLEAEGTTSRVPETAPVHPEGLRAGRLMKPLPSASTSRQLHPSSFSERWWAEFANQPPLVPRRHLSVVEHSGRLHRAFSEPFNEPDPANPHGITRPTERPQP